MTHGTRFGRYTLLIIKTDPPGQYVKEHSGELQKGTDRRGDILDVAQRLVYSKGYEQMTIQDVLDDLQNVKARSTI